MILGLHDLLVQGGTLAADNRTRNYWSRNTACTTQSYLALHEDVRNILKDMKLAEKWAHLILTYKRQVKNDLKRLGVSCKYNHLGQTSVESLSSCT